MSNKRNLAVDFARGLVAICVVVGHLIRGKAGTFIFSFHMPFFFILSGYLFRDELLEESLFKYVKRKVLHLLLPLLIYRAIGILLGIYAKERTLKSILIALFWTPGAGYFFSSLFVAVIMLWCFVWISKRIKKEYCFCLHLLTAITLVTVAVIYYEAGWHDYYLIPIRLDTTLIGFVFCMIGYRFSSYRSVLEARGGVKLLVLLPVVYILAQYNGYVNIAAMWLGKSEVLYFGVAIIMFYIIMLVAQSITMTQMFFYNLMCKIGKNSMIVYLAHGYIFQIVNNIIQKKLEIKVDRYSYPYNLIDFVFSMVIMVIIIYVYENANTKLRRITNEMGGCK